MPRKKKPTVLMGGEELCTIHHLTAKERHDAYTRLSHYLLSVHYLKKWLEQELISPADYRRMDKVLVKKYGFSDKCIFRPECRRLLEK